MNFNKTKMIREKPERNNFENFFVLFCNSAKAAICMVNYFYERF
jgi:hypothetical protein